MPIRSAACLLAACVFIIAWIPCSLSAQNVGAEVSDLERQMLEQRRGMVEQMADRRWQELLGQPEATAEIADDGEEDWKKLLGQPGTSDEDIPAELRQYRIYRLELAGDSELLEMLLLRQRIESEISGNTLSPRDIAEIVQRYQKVAIADGFYLAQIRVRPVDYRDGVVVLDVDQGRLGRMSFYSGKRKGVADSREKVPFEARYFSEAQLRRSLRGMQEGTPFSYPDFYRRIFEVNSHPDISIDTDLRVRKEFVGDVQQRYADMDLFVDEKLPLHAVLEIKNTGTAATEEWRAAATLQHLNITRHSDVLTLNVMGAVDFASLLSFAASYYLPVHIGNGAGITIYGGYSEVEAREVVPMIDLIGDGWFAAGQASYSLVANDLHKIDVSIAATWKYVQNTVVLSDDPCDDSIGVIQEPPRAALIVPATVGISYSSVRPDRWGGRNFLTSQTSFNLGESLGGSDDETLQEQRATAAASYVIERIQAARIQPILGRVEGQSIRRQWILFAKAEGQIASRAVVPAEQKAVGGMDTVRGYRERDVLGDSGVSATVELRTPLITGFLPGLREDEEKAGSRGGRLQFVAFVDGAYLSLKEVAEDQESSYSLCSAGCGLRLGIGSHAQLRFDWGVPLIALEGNEPGGRAHLSAQIQF
jgi:hemolysin activation/secretion protein